MKGRSQAFPAPYHLWSIIAIYIYQELQRALLRFVGPGALEEIAGCRTARSLKLCQSVTLLESQAMWWLLRQNKKSKMLETTRPRAFEVTREVPRHPEKQSDYAIA